jgi:SAM-dependent methyltransferase
MHWDSNARKHGLDLRSTTKTSTIKQLEINAIARVVDKFLTDSTTTSILEVGCGNGHNLFGLSTLFPNINLLGLDYSQEMIDAACKINEELKNKSIKFSTENVLNLTSNDSLKNKFELVFTDRLLINLNNWELQQKGIEQISSCVKNNGFLLLLENFTQSYSNQNLLREIIGLNPRTPDPYNRFINEDELQDFVTTKLDFEYIFSENFGSLHDLILYVLLPHINCGHVTYDHPIMESVTSLLRGIPEGLRNQFGNFGQNSLYLFKRR